MKPKKRLGQNFLINKTIANKIVNAVNLQNKVVLEIGPGKGALSLCLIEKAQEVYAFEIDKSLKQYLDVLEEEHNNFKVIYDDILNVDLNKFIEEIKCESVSLVANIPYYITGLLLNKIRDTKKIDTAVIMMQKEVGDRILAEPGNKEYGSLTVLLNLHFNISRVVNVKRTNFFPKPKVDSVVLKFERTNNHLDGLKSLKNFYEFIDAAFKMKRKTLLNNLSNYYGIGKDETTEKLQKIEPDINVFERAENITLKRFIALSNGWYKWLKKHMLKLI